MINLIKKTMGLFLVLALLQSSFVEAALPYSPDLVDKGNLWRFTYYNDAGPDHNIVYTELICFDYDVTVGGNHLQYTWFVETDPRISGTASQEGDQITMIGDVGLGPYGHYYNDIDISKSHQWQLTSTDEVKKSSGTGHHQLYLRTDYGQRSAHMNLVARRQGTCNFTPNDIGSIPSLLNDAADVLDNDVKTLCKIIIKNR